jgi:hypothetical protein
MVGQQGTSTLLSCEHDEIQQTLYAIDHIFVHLRTFAVHSRYGLTLSRLTLSRLTLSRLKLGRLKLRGGGLVAAGRMLCGNQDEAPGGRFRSGGRTEGVQDADDGNVGGQDSESNGCNDCEEDSERHEERDHDREILLY